jgi:hypothetical protein
MLRHPNNDPETAPWWLAAGCNRTPFEIQSPASRLIGKSAANDASTTASVKAPAPPEGRRAPLRELHRETSNKLHYSRCLQETKRVLCSKIPKVVRGATKMFKIQARSWIHCHDVFGSYITLPRRQSVFLSQWKHTRHSRREVPQDQHIPGRTASGMRERTARFFYLQSDAFVSDKRLSTQSAHFWQLAVVLVSDLSPRCCPKGHPCCSCSLVVVHRMTSHTMTCCPASSAASRFRQYSSPSHPSPFHPFLVSRSFKVIEM